MPGELWFSNTKKNGGKILYSKNNSTTNEFNYIDDEKLK